MTKGIAQQWRDGSTNIDRMKVEILQTSVLIKNALLGTIVPRFSPFNKTIEVRCKNNHTWFITYISPEQLKFEFEHEQSRRSYCGYVLCICNNRFERAPASFDVADIHSTLDELCDHILNLPGMLRCQQYLLDAGR